MKQKKQDSKLGKLGKSKATNEDNPKKLDKGVKQTEEKKTDDIMDDKAIGKVKVDPKKPKLEID